MAALSDIFIALREKAEHIMPDAFAQITIRALEDCEAELKKPSAEVSELQKRTSNRLDQQDMLLLERLHSVAHSFYQIYYVNMVLGCFEIGILARRCEDAIAEENRMTRK